MQKKMMLELFVEHDKEGTYFTFPFTMPADTETLTLRYSYERHRENEAKIEGGCFVTKQEVNIIDLGLISPSGTQVGTSGSDKNEIYINETSATAGYMPYRLAPGTWSILVGAYKVVPEGVTVKYELSFSKKYKRLLKGDLHTHTLASDGVLTAEELGWHALRHKLDFLAITNHNQLVSSQALPQISRMTLIPGVEWTHYLGHANFLGIDNPYDGSFVANTPEEVLSHFESARSRGALIVINHPFDEGSGFKFDLNSLPYDCLEVWNGPMRESNLRAIGLWQTMLVNGKKIPVVGGSDYHKDGLFQILGGPTTCVYSNSPSSTDILSAIKAGHAYITFAPEGPTLELAAGDAIMGDTVVWSRIKELQIAADNLRRGDILRVVTKNTSEIILEAPAEGCVRKLFTMKEPGFARVEILRSFYSGLPMLPILISNPIYFDE